MAAPNAEKELFDQVYGRGLGYYIFNAQSQLRLQQSSFYEKVALLDGGTVALTVTGVIEKIHEQIKHPLALKLGLVCLTLAMLFLFARNLCWTLIESKVMEMRFTNPTFFSALGDIGKIAYPEKLFGVFGLFLTAVGMLILLYGAVTLFWVAVQNLSFDLRIKDDDTHGSRSGTF
jgi:hypothetical protein